jgi:excisionase family DNA binding protein
MEQLLAELRALRADVAALAGMVKSPSVSPELLTPAAAAKALSCSIKTVRRLKTAGKLRVIKVGKRWKVPLAELQRFATPSAALPPRRTAQRVSPREEYEKVMRANGGRL